MVDKVNPYVDMPADVLATHLEQIGKIAQEKGLEVKQFFGIADVSVSAEDQAKIDQHSTLVAEVEKLTTASGARDLSPADIATTQVGIDGLLSQIKSIDANIDVSSIGSKFNNLERMSILNDVKPLIASYMGRIALVKKELGTKPTTDVTQQFSAPKDSETAGDLIRNATKVD